MEGLTISYVVVGTALASFLVGELVKPVERIRKLVSGRRKPAEITPTVDTVLVRCGACNSIILSPPIMRTLTDKGDIFTYRCNQCGTNVGVKI